MIFLGIKLKELRLDRNISQRELAKNIGFGQAAIARWEKNLQLPNFDAILKIAKYFNVSTDYLLGLED